MINNVFVKLWPNLRKIPIRMFILLKLKIQETLLKIDLERSFQEKLILKTDTLNAFRLTVRELYGIKSILRLKRPVWSFYHMDTKV